MLDVDHEFMCRLFYAFSLKGDDLSGIRCIHGAHSVQVCDHPFLLPDYESAGAGGAQGVLAASGKLMVLDKLLHHLQAHAHKTLLLSHHPQVCLLALTPPLPNPPPIPCLPSSSQAATHSPSLTFPPAANRLSQMQNLYGSFSTRGDVHYMLQNKSLCSPIRVQV